jgi:AraC family transcriptional regulator, regulatory protein of adaptative response / methylated-DNA-[protein]-cysteine methyltransferase
MVYSFAESPLGIVLAAANDRGLTFAGLWDNETYLLADVQSRSPGLVLRRDDAALKMALERLLAYLHGETHDLSLPVDPTGTHFQQRVWQALQRLPYGKTLSYTQLAASMGLEAKSVRAVAHGCATNPISLVIPCHRILRSNGSLGGYYWGLARKRALLELEGALPPGPQQPGLF